MAEPLQSITIVGGGTAGWLTAAMILGIRNRRNDGADLRITLIESPNVPIVGVGEATTLSMRDALGLLAIDERDFFRKCEASIKAAVKFVGWDTAAPGTETAYYHPFEYPPYLFGLPPAYHYHARARRGAKQPPLTHAMVALPALLDRNLAPRAPGQDYDTIAPYAYHLDAGKFAAYLRDFCTTLGVEHVLDDVVDVERDGRGHVAALNLRERGRHGVEFVVDCSGFQGLIIRKVFDEPFVRYDDNLMCDRAAAVQVPHRPGAPLEPFTRATALGAGWSWNVPLFSRRGTGYVYSSRFRSDDEAVAELLDFLGPDAAGLEPRVIRMNIGRSRRSWVGNCVAIGLASGFIEPLESTSIHFIQMSVRWLLDNFPDADCDPSLRDNYNGLVQTLYEEIRDFIVMHYKLSNRDDTAFWRAARHELAVPDALAERLALWRHKLPTIPDLLTRPFLFTEWSFIYVLYAKGFWKDTRFAAESFLSDADFEAYGRRLAQSRAEMLARAVDHRELLRRLRGEAAVPWYGGAGIEAEADSAIA